MEQKIEQIQKKFKTLEDQNCNLIKELISLKEEQRNDKQNIDDETKTTTQITPTVTHEPQYNIQTSNTEVYNPFQWTTNNQHKRSKQPYQPQWKQRNGPSKKSYQQSRNNYIMW